MAEIQGDVVLEYVAVSGVRFRLTDEQYVYRYMDGEWQELYKSEEPLRRLVRDIRESSYMRVISDPYGDGAGTAGRTVTGGAGSSEQLAPPRPRRKERTMAKKEETALPLRHGAKYDALLKALDLPKEKKAALERKAEDIARKRGDKMVRDYYLYMAGDIEMPAEAKRRFDHFERTGKEGSGGASSNAGSRSSNGGRATSKRKESGKTQGRGRARSPKRSDKPTPASDEPAKAEPEAVEEPASPEASTTQS